MVTPRSSLDCQTVTSTSRSVGCRARTCSLGLYSLHSIDLKTPVIVWLFLRNHFLMSPLSLQFKQVLQVSLLWTSHRLAPSPQTSAALSYSELNAPNAESFTDPPLHPQQRLPHCTHFSLQILNHAATQTSQLLLNPAAPSPWAVPVSDSSTWSPAHSSAN